VSKFGPKLAGAGGFINISQAAKKVVFVGTFNVSKLQLNVQDGRLKILQDGICPKFVDAVEHRTFAGRLANQRQQTVLYITEQCVFSLTREGLELIEIALGVKLHRDIVSQMASRRLSNRRRV
jgi:propionate CoA-transferase